MGHAGLACPPLTCCPRNCSTQNLLRGNLSATVAQLCAAFHHAHLSPQKRYIADVSDINAHLLILYNNFIYFLPNKNLAYRTLHLLTLLLVECLLEHFSCEVGRLRLAAHNEEKSRECRA